MKKLITILLAFSLLGVGCVEFTEEGIYKKNPVIGSIDTSVTLEQWGGEAKLTIGYPLEGGEVVLGASVGAELNEIVYDSLEKSVITYDIAPNKTYKDGATEIEVIFKEKPKSNKVEFDIDSTDLEFHYQQPLNEIPENDIYDCTATDCYDENDLLVFNRPENVVDSYAVYHATKMNRERGGINYGTGKVFHIFRSKIFDASGDWTWAENMNYADGTLTVTIPQDFLDRAIYPVTVDPTIGNTAEGQSNAANARDNVRCYDMDAGVSLTMPEAGTADAVWFWIGGAGGANVVYGAIYGDSGSNDPQALIASSDVYEDYDPVTKELVEFTGLGDAELANGAVFYPCIMNDHGFESIRIFHDQQATEGNGVWDDPNSCCTFPNPIAEGARAQTLNRYSGYIEYSVAGGAVAPVTPTADRIIF